MNTEDKLDHVFMILKSHKLSLISLVETKLSTSAIDSLQMKMQAWYFLHNNGTSSKGRILILLDKTVGEYVAVSSSQQHITVLLTNRGGLQFYCTCIYASNSLLERQKLWDLLHLDASCITSPWLAMGDFNNALNIKDKTGGLSIPFSNMNSFKNCLFICGLVESPNYLPLCRLHLLVIIHQF